MTGPGEPTGSGPEEGQGVKVCPACHAANRPSFRYCYRCGVRLPDEAPAPGKVAFRAAGLWIRVLAYLLDAFLLGVVTLGVTLLLSGFSVADLVGEPYYVGSPAWWRDMLVTFAIEAAYFTVCIGAWGRTAGKALLGVKVVRADGSRVSYRRALGRYLAVFATWFTFGLGFIVIALTPDRRALHDYACDTRVIRG